MRSQAFMSGGTLDKVLLKCCNVIYREPLGLFLLLTVLFRNHVTVCCDSIQRNVLLGCYRRFTKGEKVVGGVQLTLEGVVVAGFNLCLTAERLLN